MIIQEQLHCGVRRYTSPEEHAFFPDRLKEGPMKAMAQLEYPTDLLDNKSAEQINFNPILLQKYIETIVPNLTQRGDDEQHGSSALCDIAVLQALSRRVHYGKFVAESKYRGDPEAYQKLIDKNDAEGVMELLTNAAVEEKVLRRAKLKAATYGREPLLTSSMEQQKSNNNKDTTSIVAAAAAAAVVAAIEAMGDESNDDKVDPSVIESIYRDIIIPLTKDIEVAYLFRRCGKEPPPEYGPDRMSIDMVKEVVNGVQQGAS